MIEFPELPKNYTWENFDESPYPWLIVCSRCGSVVFNIVQHDEFHRDVSRFGGIYA